MLNKFPSFILEMRKKHFRDGVDAVIPNLTIEQLVKFISEAFSAVKTHDVRRSYEIAGFAEKHLCSKRLRKIVDNPPKLSELPEEWQVRYDPTGLKVIRRGANKANPKNLGKEWTCVTCGKQYATKHSAKAHREAPGGCPSIETLNTFKPMKQKKAFFFDNNFD